MEELQDNQLKRTMPHSDEAEMSVIGSMLMSKDAVPQAAEIVSADDFYNKQYGAMFSCMQELYNEGVAIDEITLQDKLKTMDLSPTVTSTEYILNIMSSTPTSVTVKNYAKIVKDKSLLRKIITVNQDIENECYAGKESVENILEKSEKEVFNLVKNKGAGDTTPISQIVLNAVMKIDQASRTQGSVTGVPTGFIDLDYRTAGLQPSDLILVAARPSMGKTAFVLNIAQHTAVRNDYATAIFSLEMSKEQLINRMLSLESGVEAQKLRTGNLKDDEWAVLTEASTVIGQSKLIIDDTSSITIAELKSKCRKYKLDHDIKLIIIDYLQLMETGTKTESHQLAIAEISRSLKALARELNVPVVALSQLSRSVESREDKRPMLSDLRDSGAIEQDADVVMFIYREDYYKKDTDNKNVSEIITAKQRNGPVGTDMLAWMPQLTKFGNLSKERIND